MNWASIAVAGLTIAAAYAQTNPPPRPEFDVASIKPSNTLDGTTLGVGNGGASEHNVTLKHLIAFAYRLQDFQILRGPRWIGSERFDIEAKTADRRASPDRLRLMLQSLLADRFQLKVHHEAKSSSVYALVVGKGGPKIRPSPDQTSPDVNGPSPPGAGPNRGAIRVHGGSIIGNGVTLAFFSSVLSQRLELAVIDKTNLTGRFDIHLEWTPDVGENPLSPAGDLLPPATVDPSRPSIFAAIQEQLGLKLESAKAPVQVLVIDHVAQPSGN